MRIALILLLSLSCHGLLAQETPVSSAKIFVGSLYAAYMRSNPPSYLEPALAAQTFSPSMLAAIKHDEPASGEVGRLDHDPICGCQDADGLKVDEVHISNVEGGRTHARIRLQFGTVVKLVELFLVDTPKGWKVDDVAGADGRSLKKTLTAR